MISARVSGRLQIRTKIRARLGRQTVLGSGLEKICEVSSVRVRVRVRTRQNKVRAAVTVSAPARL